jgi:hypothetical protein
VARADGAACTTEGEVCYYPNVINILAFKEVKALCMKNKLEWINQAYTGFI